MNGGSLVTGSTAGALPVNNSVVEVSLRKPRKRRRPALSCVLCRRRKVKCDRKLPCSQCSQYNNAPCKYDDPEVAALGKHSSTPQTLHNSSRVIASNQTHGVLSSREPIIFNNQNISAPPGFESRSPSSSVPLVPAPAAEHPQSEQHVEGSLGGAPPQPDSSVQELKDRVQKLEALITSSSKYGPRPSENDSLTLATNIPKLRGNIDKTRFFGKSHWMNTYDEVSISHINQRGNDANEQFDQLRSLKNYENFENGSEIQKLVKQCKEMARVVKAERPINSYTLPDFKSHMPSRETADQLVQLYFQTFESTYRILHRGFFYKEYEQYWKDPAAAKDSFTLKLLLVLAIGTAFYDDAASGNALRSLAPQWIYAAQAWLSAPGQKARLNLVGLEVQCLLILAHQAHSLENDFLWTSVGTLMRNAMSMGFHRDPSHFPKISVFHAELRRRMWATIIELATQSSLDCGMPPMFSYHEFDCEPPSNYDDADIDEQTKVYPPRKPDSVLTDTSIQITLLRSLPTRLEISRMLNDFRTVPPYDKVITLSSELSSHIRAHSPFYTTFQHSNHRFTASAKNLLELFTQRFLLALHHRFASQAKTDLRFYYSRKMAVDASMAMFSRPSTVHSESEPAEEFTRTRLLSGGFFHESVSRASAAIALELITQINEDSFPGSNAGKVARGPLHDMLEGLVEVVKRRIEFGYETNVKPCLFISIVRAQTVAMEKGEGVREAIVERAKRVAEEAYGLLRGRVTGAPLDGLTPASRAGNSEGMEESNVDWDLLVSAVSCGRDSKC